LALCFAYDFAFKVCFTPVVNDRRSDCLQQQKVGCGILIVVPDKFNV